jgi:hypothetical protein
LVGQVTLANNLGHVEAGGNQIAGPVSVTGNSGQGRLGSPNGGSELEANTIGGVLSCSGNVPAVTNDGEHNTVSIARLGQCGAAGF